MPETHKFPLSVNVTWISSLLDDPLLSPSSSSSFPDSPPSLSTSSSSVLPPLTRVLSNGKSSMKKNLFSHVPYAVLRFLSSNTNPLKEPFIKCYNGVIFFADVSNFSMLASKIAKHKDIAGGYDR